jgi:hypothetical protein
MGFLGGRLMRTRLPSPAIVVTLIALAMIVVAGASARPAGGYRPAEASLDAGSVVPLVVCRTRFANPPAPKRLAFPSLTRLTVVTGLARSLAAYTDTQGYMTVVAPRQWRCSASYGADGSGGVSVYPQASISASGGEAVVGSETSACFGCTVGQACVFFPAAARAYSSTFGSACPHHRPRREAVTHLSATVVAFKDPPYVKGDGVPSGGQFPANGVMTYVPRSNDGSYLETCTFPENVHSTCAAILNDFVARYRNK